MASDEDSKPGEVSAGRFYTLREAAAQLKLRPGTLSKAARKIGACSEFGRTLVMSDEDIRAVYEANRVERTVSNRAVPATTLSAYQLHKRLIELTTKKKRPKLNRRG